MSKPLQRFGGDWTTRKLESVRQYLTAYQTALKHQPFTRYYIDAFAGTGYNAARADENHTSTLFDDLTSPEARQFVDGSARIALQIPQPFDQYIFVERDPERHSELLKLKADFPHLADRIQPVNDEANSFLTSFCASRDWIRENCRAVVFLDPFGMQVTWTTIQAISKTRAIDLWLLFPLGIGVMRMLPRHGEIPAAWRNALNAMFGETGWYEAFYTRQETRDLFGTTESTVRMADYDLIAHYFVKRLKTLFPHVADNPLPLVNSSNCPLYLLCFAAANPDRGGVIAKRIAAHILRQ